MAVCAILGRQLAILKLAYKFFGPYKILARVDSLAYKLDLPPDNKIHPAFHVSQLKPFTTDHALVLTQLPTPNLTVDDLQPQQSSSVALSRREILPFHGCSCTGLLCRQPVPPRKTTTYSGIISPMWTSMVGSISTRGECHALPICNLGNARSGGEQQR